MDCLLVIDVQNGFVSKITEHVIPRIHKLLSVFQNDMIIATKFINVNNSGFTDILNWHRLTASPEIDIIPEIEDVANEIIEKNTYTAYSQKLESIINENNIDRVFLVGIDTDCCVLKTAIDLFEHNIEPIVLTYYCYSNGGAKSQNAAIQVLYRTIGKKQVITKEFLEK